MKIKEMYCEVCNHLLDIRKDNVYEVNIAGTILVIQKIMMLRTVRTAAARMC